MILKLVISNVGIFLGAECESIDTKGQGKIWALQLADTSDASIVLASRQIQVTLLCQPNGGFTLTRVNFHFYNYAIGFKLLVDI